MTSGIARCFMDVMMRHDVLADIWYMFDKLNKYYLYIFTVQHKAGFENFYFIDRTEFAGWLWWMLSTGVLEESTCC
jgi:hypothetical protein